MIYLFIWFCFGLSTFGICESDEMLRRESGESVEAGSFSDYVLMYVLGPIAFGFVLRGALHRKP